MPGSTMRTDTPLENVTERRSRGSGSGWCVRNP